MNLRLSICCWFSASHWEKPYWLVLHEGGLHVPLLALRDQDLEDSLREPGLIGQGLEAREARGSALRVPGDAGDVGAVGSTLECGAHGEVG